MNEEEPTPYARQVGLRLRKVRKQQRLSLQAVEKATSGRYKASVLGAYERGERVVSVPRLHGLAEFYNLPVDQLLPPHNAAEPNSVQLPGHVGAAPARSSPTSATQTAGVQGSCWTRREKVTIDLTRLKEAPTPEREFLGRYLRMIQVQRQDFNGRVLTVRSDDLPAMAALIDTQPELICQRLDALGLRH